MALPSTRPGRAEENKRLLCLDCGTSTASSRRRGRNQPRRLAGDPVIFRECDPCLPGQKNCQATEVTLRVWQKKVALTLVINPASCLSVFGSGAWWSRCEGLKKWEKHTI